MKIIEINTLQIEITDNTITTVRNYSMNIKQEILIRNKHDAAKLSKKTSQMFEENRKQRLEQAVKNNDMMYLNSLMVNVSVLDLVKEILSRKIKK